MFGMVVNKLLGVGVLKYNLKANHIQVSGILLLLLKRGVS
jgi:hypothetical protein